MKQKRSDIRKHEKVIFKKTSNTYLSSLLREKKRRLEKQLELLSVRFYTFTQGSFLKFVGSSYTLFLRLKKKVFNFFQVILGNIFSRYISIKEKDRLWTYNLEREGKKHSIFVGIFKHSRWIIYNLVFFFSLSFILDLVFWKTLLVIKDSSFLVNNFTLPSYHSIEVGLEIFIGAISAVLGLIFALYTVGAQLSGDKYSEEVTKFVNQESVSDYFFGFLIFTDLYALLVLLRLHLISGLPIVSFVIASFFVAASFLGILIFKSHYINSLIPLNLFRSLWRLCREQIQLVTNPYSYKRKSWNIAIHARNSTNRYLNIFGDLFRDLIRNNNWDDASYAPVILGGILRDYLELKKFIDKEKGWWFFERYEQVKAEDLDLFTIKANYELQGKGPLHIPKTAKDWLEDKAIELFKEISTCIPDDKSNKLAINVSKGYKQFLVGDYEERRGYPPKLVPGVIQNQEFDVFQKGLDSYFSIWQKIDFFKPAVATAFLNDYFAISEGLLEEWDINKAIKIAKSFYKGGELNRDKQFAAQVDLPTYTRDILVNYWERLEVEQELEGKIVTPKNRFAKEIKDILVEKRKEIIVGYLGKLFDNSDQIIVYLYKQKQFEYAGHFIKMQYEWISRLLHLGDEEIAKTFASRIEKNIAFIAYLPRKVVLDLELLEQAEKGFFVSLTKRAKTLFKVYSRTVVFVLIIVRDQENDQDKLFRLIRLPVIWGGITYLVSELDQDFYYITTLTQALEKSFRPGWMLEILEKVADLKLARDIWWETTRYHSWYMFVLNDIREKLAKKPFRESGEIGFGEIYDHPSPFIQQLAMWGLIAEEKSVDGFLDWLKRREEAKKLAYMLTQVIKKHEQKK